MDKSNLSELNYFRKETTVMKIFGVSFAGNESRAYHFYSRLLLIITIVIHPFLGLREMCAHGIEVYIDYMVYEFAYFMVLGKIGVTYYNRLKLGRILNKLHKEPFLPNMERGGEVEKNIIDQCVWITNVQVFLQAFPTQHSDINLDVISTHVSGPPGDDLSWYLLLGSQLEQVYRLRAFNELVNGFIKYIHTNWYKIFVYWGMAFSTVACTIIYTLFKRILSNDYHDWVLTYGPLTLLDTTKSPYYEITLFYQNFAMSCCTILFTATDLLIASVLAHISYQFRILQNYLQRIVKNTYINDYKGNPDSEMTSITPMIPWKFLQHAQAKFLNYHLAIIDIAREMEEAFSPLLLLVYLGTIGLLCFEIYRGSMTTNYLQLIRTMGEIVSFLVQIGTLSFWGEQVIFQSQSVASAGYETDFVGTDLKFQKGLLLTMIRSQRPVKLTAGKFAFIQLFTFTWVCKTSYSAFMILRSAQK